MAPITPTQMRRPRSERTWPYREDLAPQRGPGPTERQLAPQSGPGPTERQLAVSQIQARQGLGRVGKTRKQEELWRQNRPAPPQTQIPPLKNRGPPRHSSLPCASAQEPWESPLAPESSTVLQWGFLSRGRVPIHPPCPAEQHHPHLQERRAQPSSPAGLGEQQLQVGGGGDYSEGSPGSAVWSPCVQSNPQTGTPWPPLPLEPSFFSGGNVAGQQNFLKNT